MKKRISLNGSAHETDAVTVTALVEETGLPAPTLLVELDGRALHRSEWTSARLEDGAKVEFLRVAAGG